MLIDVYWHFGKVLGKRAPSEDGDRFALAKQAATSNQNLKKMISLRTTDTLAKFRAGSVPLLVGRFGAHVSRG